MYTAINEAGNKVTAAEAILAEKQQYCCPKCGVGVNLRNGYVKIEHFAHNPHNSCEYAAESMLHLQMKTQIYQNLNGQLKGQVKSIELEKSLGNCRPDIFIEGYKRSIAIEVQTSSLTPEQILFRTQLYHNNGIYVLWVLPFDQDRISKIPPQAKHRVFVAFRIKEYERIIMYLYFKMLILWDVNRDYIKGFHLIKLKDSFSDFAEFYDRNAGETRSFSPKKLKTVKEIEQHRSSVQLSDFYPKKVAAFPMPQGAYDLPARAVMLYDRRPKI